MKIPVRYDMPDDYQYMQGTVRFPVTDIGELAVRMGSPDTYDRRGEVLFMDTFNTGVNRWLHTLNGTGAEIYVTPDYAIYSPYSALIRGGSSIPLLTGISLAFSSTSMGKCGIEVSIQFLTNFSYVSIGVSKNTGTHLLQGAIHLYSSAGALKYTNSTGGETTIDTGFSWYELTSVYRFIKLVVDFDREEYVRVMIDNTMFDLSGIGLTKTVETVPEFHGASIILCGRVLQADKISVGHVIITGNEP